MADALRISTFVHSQDFTVAKVRSRRFSQPSSNFAGRKAPVRKRFCPLLSWRKPSPHPLRFARSTRSREWHLARSKPKRAGRSPPGQIPPSPGTDRRRTRRTGCRPQLAEQKANSFAVRARALGMAQPPDLLRILRDRFLDSLAHIGQSIHLEASNSNRSLSRRSYKESERASLNFAPAIRTRESRLFMA